MPDSIFSRLLSLKNYQVPEEDFFTEVISWLLEKRPGLLFSWAGEFLQLKDDYKGCMVDTQVDFSKLDDHQIDSCPDMVIRLIGQGDQEDIVFVESKLGSGEHDQQLPRYADQLANRYPDARKRILVYFTRGYDPKDENQIIKKAETKNICFKQMRWHEFYSFLKRQKISEDDWIQEILHFMKERGMAQITQITPAVLASFSAFPDIYNFIQAVFEGDVTARFIQIAGRPKPEGDRWWNVKNYRRYLLIGKIGTELTFFTGFRMPESVDSFPELIAALETPPNHPKRNKYIEIFRQIEYQSIDKPTIWKCNNIDDPKGYAQVLTTVSLTEVISEQDHVVALKKLFLHFMKEVEQFTAIFPSLTSIDS